MQEYTLYATSSCEIEATCPFDSGTCEWVCPMAIPYLNIRDNDKDVGYKYWICSQGVLDHDKRPAGSVRGFRILYSKESVKLW